MGFSFRAQKVLPYINRGGSLLTCGFILLLSGCSSSYIFQSDGNLLSVDASRLSLHKEEARAKAPRSERAKPADRFIDSVGVDTHLSYDNTPYYTHWPEVLEILRSSGIRHIRDGFHDWDLSSAFVKEHRALASAGIHTTYIVPFDKATTPEVLQRFSFKVNDLEAIEGPNECDAAQNCGGGNRLGIANAISFQPVLMSAGRLLRVPVLGPSFTSQEAYTNAGDLSRAMTIINLHVYFGGRNPGSSGWGDADAEHHNYGSMDWWLDQGQRGGHGLPVTITETGYMMPEVARPYTISPALGASYLPRTLLLSFNKNILHTFLYELLDEVSSPDYGLLTTHLRPKPAFTAVSSLLHLLADPGPTFTAGSLTYVLRSNSKDLNHTLLQKRDGSFWLILWREASAYDPSTNTAVALPEASVTLSLDQKFAVDKMYKFDDAGEIRTEKVKIPSSDLQIPVDGHLAVFEIWPKSQIRK